CLVAEDGCDCMDDFMTRHALEAIRIYNRTIPLAKHTTLCFGRSGLPQQASDRAPELLGRDFITYRQARACDCIDSISLVVVSLSVEAAARAALQCSRHALAVAPQDSD